MPTDRLFKFSIPGLMFLLSVVSFDYVFGGTLVQTPYHILSLLGIFFSTPVIGVIIGTFLFGYLKFIHGHEIHFHMPTNPDLIRWILKADQDLLKRIIVDGKIKARYNESTERGLYPYYQVKIRQSIQGEELKFLERRWSIYWTHANNIFAIALALFCVVVIELKQMVHLNWDITLGKFLIIATALLYARLAILEIRRTKEVANKVEHLFLEEAMRKELKCE